jgi:hypothetical protein
MPSFIRERAFQAVDKHGRIQPGVVNLDHLKSPKAVNTEVKPEPAVATAKWVPVEEDD